MENRRRTIDELTRDDGWLGRRFAASFLIDASAGLGMTWEADLWEGLVGG